MKSRPVSDGTGNFFSSKWDEGGLGNKQAGTKNKTERGTSL